MIFAIISRFRYRTDSARNIISMGEIESKGYSKIKEKENKKWRNIRIINIAQCSHFLDKISFYYTTPRKDFATCRRFVNNCIVDRAT
jgi:hypothetical protein